MENTFTETLHNLIKECKEEISDGLKQKLQNYIDGISTPDINMCIKIAQTFNCSLDYLFGISNQKGTSPIISAFDSDKFLSNYTKILEQNNITHWKLCRLIDINESTIRKWKKGTKPSMETFVKLATSLNTSVDLLIQ